MEELGKPLTRCSKIMYKTCMKGKDFCRLLCNLGLSLSFLQGDIAESDNNNNSCILMTDRRTKTDWVAEEERTSFERAEVRSRGLEPLH